MKRLSVRPADERCSCNACSHRNYLPTPAIQGDVDNLVPTIYDVRIGNFCNRLCGQCLNELGLMIVQNLDGAVINITGLRAEDYN